MSNSADICVYHDRVTALAHDRLSTEERPAVQEHLETCRACRGFFREKTGSWFPQIDNYTVIEKIGEGGFGTVYKAVHHAKERTEALKVLYAKTDLLEQYFENEIHLIARLRHPNIAILYDAQHSTYPPYYTMEFVEGHSLDEYFRDHRSSLADRIHMIRKVAAAIGYAHSQGVIHRDLKPQNILVDGEGEPRIVDFGIAKRLEAAAHAGRPTNRDEGAIGTVGYIAPEQVAGGPVDARADIYALGALLFHIVTGEPARLAADTERLVPALRERSVSAADDLAAIIRRCIAQDPGRRYPTCEQLVTDLQNYLDGRSISARPNPGVGYRTTRIFAWVVRNHPAAVRTTVVALAALVLTLVFSVLGARYTLAGRPGEQTMLVGFTLYTTQALRDRQIGADIDGLSLSNPKSLRMLHGRLMERLAVAKPKVVVWDYYFPDCQPEFDRGFVAGIDALRPTPVVIGVKHFDINGQPQICGDIASAVHSYGALHGQPPEIFPDAFLINAAITRGMSDPVPGLGVAGMAAALHPDCVPELRVTEQHCEVRFKRRDPGPGEAWRLSEVRDLNVPWVRQAAATDHTGLSDNDEVAIMQIPAMKGIWSGSNYVPYEDVLTASNQQLVRWFSGKAVLIGQMIPAIDQHRLADGTQIYGCEIQATTLDQLLSGTRVVPVSDQGLGLRMLLWSLLAASLAMLPRFSGRTALSSIVIACVSLAVIGVGVAVGAASYITNVWRLEVAMAASALLTAGGLAMLVHAIRARQLQLAPESIVLSHEGTSLQTTVLATATEPQQ